MVWVASGWFGRVWAARILEDSKSRYARELEALKQDFSREIEMLRASNDHISKSVQAELDKNIYVTKAHFDVELAALKLLWQHLKLLELALNPLRPIFALMPAGESPEEKRKRLDLELSKNMDTFSDAYNAALSAVENQRPFYPGPIWESANAALQVAHLELSMIQINTQRFEGPWYLDGRKNQLEFASHMGNLEQGIRNRIEKLSIRS